MIDPLSSLTGPGQGSSIDRLVAMYMSLESKPVDVLKAQQDQLTLRSAVFTDLSSKITSLKTLADELSTSTSSVFDSHTVASSDVDQATGTASTSASNGTYALTDVTLAKAHRVQSGQLATTWSAAGSGTFSVNGALISVTAGQTLSNVRDAINNASYASGREVNATIITGTFAGVNKDVLVLEGKHTGASYSLSVADLTGSTLADVGLASTTNSAVAISGATASSEVLPGNGVAKVWDNTLGDANSWYGDPGASSWSVTLDLGAGATVSRLEWGRDQGGAVTSGTPKDYTIEYSNDGGTTWTNLKTVTSRSLAAGAAQEDTFYPVSAKLVRLSITATSDGTAPAIDEMKLYNDSSTLTQAVLQAPTDATFTVNGISATRSSNTALTDVVSGLTINLLDTTGATLTVAGDTSGMRAKIDSFLQKLNDLTDYLKVKSDLTKNESTGVYARGPLWGYSLYTSLRSGLASDMGTGVTGLPAGDFNRMSELGITMDTSNHYVVSDSTVLTNALTSDANKVAAVFGGSGGVAKRIYDRLSPYVVAPTGETYSYISREQDSISSQQTSVKNRLSTVNERLAVRENALRQQFTQLQMLMISASQQQQRLQSIFSMSSGWGLS